MQLVKLFWKSTAILVIGFVAIILQTGCESKQTPKPDTENTTISNIDMAPAKEEIEKMKYSEYIMKYGIDISNDIAAEDGEINQNGAFFCFTLKEGRQGNVRAKLKKCCGEELEIDINTMPGFLGHPVAQKLKSENLVAEWERLDAGTNGAFTHPIYIYMTENNSVYYLYFFD